MSTQKQLVEITPPDYQQVHETMIFRGYQCPVCNGQGAFIHYYAHDDYETTPCDYCDATGKLKAEVRITWNSDTI